MSDMLIHNVRVVTGNAVIDPGWVHVVSGRIHEVGNGPAPADLAGVVPSVVDAAGGWLVPGFIDLHVHGGGGAEVMEGTVTAIRKIARFHAQHGTTAWLPTTLTAPIEDIRRALAAVHAFRTEEADASTGAAALGVHLEGPFIAPSRPGAQDPAHIVDPTADLVDALVHFIPGLVRKVTLAPERPGGLDAVSRLAAAGIIVSIGHTEASADEARAAIARGARHATHLFNAMRGFHHRHPGAGLACLLAADVVCEMICDGLHVDFEMVRLALHCKGTQGMVLITDAIAATGCPPGRYRLGTVDIVTDEERSVLASDGTTLAGSLLTMDRAVANAMDRLGVSVVDAVAMASTVPARELGLADRKGRIAPGYDADLVWLDETWAVQRTWIGGREVYRRG